MASYHFKNQIFKRSNGDSSIAAAAYRSGERLYDEKQQRFHDYRSRKGSVAHTEILAPEGSAAFLLDRQQLWQHVEDLEKRKDAQLSREFELALPKELTADQRLSCVRDFINDECVSRGMVADLAIHAPQVTKGDHPDNHHAHVMLTMRQATRTGLRDVKTREWNSKNLHNHWRNKWAEYQNRDLKKHGHKARVDHRTLKEQRQTALARGDLDRAASLDRQPEIHVGKAARYRNDIPVSRDRETRSYSGNHRQRNYTKNDRGSRAEHNGNILNSNRQRASKYSHNLQSQKAHLMQRRVPRTDNSTQPTSKENITWASEGPGPFTFSPGLPFNKTKLQQEMGEAVDDYLSFQKALAKLGLIDRQLNGFSARIATAMGIEAARTQRYLDFRDRYLKHQQTHKHARSNQRTHKRNRNRTPVKISD